MSRVFISYASADRALIENLAQTLMTAGHEVWWDYHLLAGADFRDKIQEKLGEAELVIVLWSHASVKSRYVRDEAAEGADRGILVPIKADNLDIKRIPVGFRSFHIPNISDVKKIRSSISSMLGLAVEPQDGGAPGGSTSRSVITESVSLAEVADAGMIFDCRRSSLDQAEPIIQQLLQDYFDGATTSKDIPSGLYLGTILTFPQQISSDDYFASRYSLLSVFDGAAKILAISAVVAMLRDSLAGSDLALHDFIEVPSFRTGIVSACPRLILSRPIAAAYRKFIQNPGAVTLAQQVQPNGTDETQMRSLALIAASTAERLPVNLLQRLLVDVMSSKFVIVSAKRQIKASRIFGSANRPGQSVIIQDVATED